jgi:hypothetical protein
LEKEGSCSEKQRGDSMQIPCENCITFPVCKYPRRFGEIIGELECPILEDAIDEEVKKLKIEHEQEVIDYVVGWYENKTGYELP